MTITNANKNFQKLLLPTAIAAVLLVGAGVFVWTHLIPHGPGQDFASANGRIEATEVDVSTKLPGRVQEILVNEGDFVTAGQPLARMQVQSLQAQHDEAVARQQQAVSEVASAEAQVAVRESDYHAAQAQTAQRESELDAARRRLSRR